MDSAGGSRDQAAVSWRSSFLSKDCGFGVAGRCCSGAGVASRPRCRAWGSLGGSGGAEGGCEGFAGRVFKEVEVCVKICFKACSEDCVEGWFQVCVGDCVKGRFEDSFEVISKVKVVKVFAEDGQR